jgi:hypothetical protein
VWLVLEIEIEIEEGALVVWEMRGDERREGFDLGDGNFSEHVTPDSITTLMSCI